MSVQFVYTLPSLVTVVSYNFVGSNSFKLVWVKLTSGSMPVFANLSST